MSIIRLDEVFKTSGIPTYTFVRPKEYTELIVNLRTPGRGLVVEGPSGIGKTTAVEKALIELDIHKHVTKLSARKSSDVEYIRELPELGNVGTVIIDDFHILPNEIKVLLANYLKVLADEENKNAKLIILGINRAGENLINFANDLVNRIDVIKFETNPDYKLHELITKGEEILNIDINIKSEIVEASYGSFYLSQMLCHGVCIYEDIRESAPERLLTRLSFELVKTKVWNRLHKVFGERCKQFCTGTKLRKEGRAPYLHILNWLAHCEDWTLSLRDATRSHPELRGSVTQVLQKDYLQSIIEQNKEIRDVLFFSQDAAQLTIQDPQFLFYIRNISWKKFAIQLGFLAVEFESKYDFAISFAGTERDIAESIAKKLQENEIEVFYDRFEQHRILAEDVEDYLQPIYESEASFVIVLLSAEYPKRIWTKLESDSFRERYKTDSVIPIWFSDALPGMFDDSRRKGGVTFDKNQPLESQVDAIVDLLIQKLAEARDNLAVIQ